MLPPEGRIEMIESHGEPRPSPLEERIWERGYEGHARAQLRRLAGLPLMEKLRWLEEAQELVGRLRGTGREPGSDSPPPTP